jgi:hypothetical protein
VSSRGLRPLEARVIAVIVGRHARPKVECQAADGRRARVFTFALCVCPASVRRWEAASRWLSDAVGSWTLSKLLPVLGDANPCTRHKHTSPASIHYNPLSLLGMRRCARRLHATCLCTVLLPRTIRSGTALPMSHAHPTPPSPSFVNPQTLTPTRPLVPSLSLPPHSTLHSPLSAPSTFTSSL